MTDTNAPFLSLRNVNKNFGGLQAVDNVSFDVQQNTVKAIIGPNGAGKSTLFNCIGGNLSASNGTVTFQNQEIQTLKPHQIARHGISRTYQNLNLFHGMTALENVMVGRHVQSASGFFSNMLNLPHTWAEERSIRKKAMDLLELLHIGDVADTEVTNLSFGQQRSVEFARALATEPKLLLMDEPAAGLNMYETARIGEQIKEICTWGITVLLVEHDMSLVMDISDEICVINFGKKIAEGRPEEIQGNEEVIRIYLGEADYA